MQRNRFYSHLEFDNAASLSGEESAGASSVSSGNQMSQVRSSDNGNEPSAGKANKPAIVFAQAMSLYRQGELDRAIELFDEVVESREEDPQRDVACVAAHISLYKIHRSLGHEHEANVHFSKAVSLGANAKRLKEF